MPILASGKPHRTSAPTVLVENPLDPGDYRFQLVCADDAGNLSAPAQITVTVTSPTRVDPRLFGTRVTLQPATVLRGRANLRPRE
jgi:hypothetical protein